MGRLLLWALSKVISSLGLIGSFIIANSKGERTDCCGSTALNDCIFPFEKLTYISS